MAYKCTITTIKNSHNYGRTGRQKKNQVGLLEVKTTISKNEDTLNGHCRRKVQ